MLSRSFVLKPKFLRNTLKTVNMSSTAVPPLLMDTNTGGNVVTVTLNRPKALNALDKEMCAGIRDMLHGWKNGEKKPSAFILKGA